MLPVRWHAERIKPIDAPVQEGAWADQMRCEPFVPGSWQVRNHARKDEEDEKEASEDPDPQKKMFKQVDFIESWLQWSLAEHLVALLHAVRS